MDAIMPFDSYRIAITLHKNKKVEKNMGMNWPENAGTVGTTGL